MLPAQSRDVPVPSFWQRKQPRGTLLPQALPSCSSSVLGARALLFVVGSKVRYFWGGGCGALTSLLADELNDLGGSPGRVSGLLAWAGSVYLPSCQHSWLSWHLAMLLWAVSKGRGGVRKGPKPVRPAWKELHPALSEGVDIGCAPSWQLSRACKSSPGSWQGHKTQGISCLEFRSGRGVTVFNFCSQGCV